jgi:hypothetical protein
MAEPRRFPPPWTFEEYRGLAYIVRDANGQALAFVYCDDEPGRHARFDQVLTLPVRTLAHFFRLANHHLNG